MPQIRFFLVVLLASVTVGSFAQDVASTSPSTALDSVRAAWMSWAQAQQKALKSIAIEKWESDSEFRQRQDAVALSSRAPAESALLASREALRTTLWALPAAQVEVKIGTFDAKRNQWTLSVTSRLPELPYRGTLVLAIGKALTKSTLETTLARPDFRVRVRYQLDWDDGQRYGFVRRLDWGTGSDDQFRVLGSSPAYGAWVTDAGGQTKPYRIVEDTFVAAGPALPGVTTDQIAASGPFRMATTPVTRTQFWRVMGWLPGDPEATWDEGRWPIDRVSWYQAIWFCRVLSLIDGLDPVYALADPGITSDHDLPFERNPKRSGWRLPTRDEFFFAAAGGAKSRGYSYVGSEDPYEAGWWISNSEGTLHPVATKVPNELGLFDMGGNVWQWLDTPPPITQWVHGAGASNFRETHMLGSSALPGLFPDAELDLHATPGDSGIGFRILRQGGQE